METQTQVQGYAVQLRSTTAAEHRRLVDRAGRLNARLSVNGRLQGELFIRMAVDAYNFKRDNLWYFVERDPEKGQKQYSSFDEYIADPENSLTASTIHLGVQVAEFLFIEFWIPWVEAMLVGQKKLQRLIPFLLARYGDHLWVLDAVDGPERFRDFDREGWKLMREEVLEWVHKAQRLSDTALADEIGSSKGWDTLFHQPVTMSFLREFKTVDALLAFFALSGVDDSEQVVCDMKRRRRPDENPM